MANELSDNRDRAATTPGLLLKHRARARALEREIRTVRRRLLSKCEELQEKRERLHRLAGRGSRTTTASVAAQGCTACTRPSITRLLRATFCASRDVTARAARPRHDTGRPSLVVVPRPLLVGRRAPVARDIEALVLGADLGTRKRAAEACSAPVRPFSERSLHWRPRRASRRSSASRSGVWDRGRCVDCRTSESLGYDQIVPFSKGGSRWVANVSFRCAPCRERRRRNETSKRRQPRTNRGDAVPTPLTGAPARRGRRRRGGGGRSSADRTACPPGRFAAAHDARRPRAG